MELNLQSLYDEIVNQCELITTQKISPYYIYQIFKASDGAIYHVYLDVFRGKTVDHMNISR